LLRKPLKNKGQSLLRRQYRYPYNPILQGNVVATDPLIEEGCKGLIFGPEAVPLNRELVEDKYGSITMAEAFCQDFIRVKSIDSPPSEAIWNGSIEKGDVSSS
jgi:hypothetical protein